MIVATVVKVSLSSNRHASWESLTVDLSQKWSIMQHQRKCHDICFLPPLRHICHMSFVANAGRCNFLTKHILAHTFT